MQVAIPCTMMRGGTSRGPFFLASDLPEALSAKERVLLAVMGTGNTTQVDGIGGGSSLTNKAAIVSRSSHPEADIDYLFAQVSVSQHMVDFTPSCGNMLSAVVPFAIENGLVSISNDETCVRVHNVNTSSIIEVVLPTPNGRFEYDGSAAIDGVEGTAAPILLNFLNVTGTKTGTLLPTGNLRDTFDGIEVSCVDAAVPMVLIPAESLGKTGYESKEELDSDRLLLARIEKIRREAGFKMGLGDISGKVIPKVGLIAKPQNGGSISSRYFVPENCHAAHAVTGAICVSVCAMLPGSVSDGLIDRENADKTTIQIEHPSGVIDLVLELEGTGAQMLVPKAGLVRTARKIFRGELYVSDSIWSGRHTKAS